MSRRYCILLQGEVPDRMLEPYCDEFTITRSGQITSMTGAIVDAAQLHGLISHLTGAGLEITEITSSPLLQGSPGA